MSTEPGRASVPLVTSLDVSDVRHTPAYLEKLMGAVRPEFRRAVFVANSAEFRPGAAVCLVATCARFTISTGRSFCRSHQQRWRRLGRPPAEAWAATEGNLSGHGTPPACRVPACRFGRGGGRGLCIRHGRQWTRAGRPDLENWISVGGPKMPNPPDQPGCALDFCSLLAHASSPFCFAHDRRWIDHDRPSIVEFANRIEVLGVERLDLSPLTPKLRLEMQYALQCRVDLQRYQMTDDLNALVRWLPSSGVDSLLSHSIEEWRARLAKEPVNGRGRAFILFAVHHLDILRHGGGWDHEYDLDVWDLRRVRPEAPWTGYRHFDFRGINPLWLRDLGKRHLRWSLDRGIAHSRAYHYMRALRRLSDALELSGASEIRADEFSRVHIEAFLSHVASTVPQAKYRRTAIGCIGTFLDDARRFGWAPEIPAVTAIYREDYPALDESAPRAVDEDVMRQVESPENMARWGDPSDRLIAQIIIACGRRVSEVVSLRTDCLMRDSASGEPFLRYWNHKMKRQGFCPLDDALAEGIEEAVARVRTKHPTGTVALFPTPRSNPDGQRHISGGTFRQRLKQWLHECAIIDPATELTATITPHQWRHTFATRLLDADVELPVIARLLDHDSLEMTLVYAKINSKKARSEWERARKINGQGRTVLLEPDEELADAAFLAHRVRSSRHALPNGYCRLASHKSCEHVNPCLSCSLFVTTRDFLPDHQRHRSAVAEHLQLNIEAKRTRQAEKDAQDLSRLDSIINALEQPDATATAGVPHLPEDGS